MYDNPTLCAACGHCCMHMPGACFPEDFADATAIETALASGKYAIDWWEGDPRPDGELQQAYYVRPATKGREGQRYDASWGGPCTFLTATGCSLASDERPTECRQLEPRSDGNCLSHGLGKREAAIAWIPLRHLLED